MKQHTGEHWNGTEGAEGGPVSKGKPDHHEPYGGPHRHKGGVHDGHRGSGLADNHTADRIGERSADEMSNAADDYLKLIR
jgi:hypothetical protein